MGDPVICIGDGNTYERAAIENYLKQNSSSPVTGAAMGNAMSLFPNNALKGLIEKFMQGNMHNLQQDIAYDSGQEGLVETGYI